MDDFCLFCANIVTRRMHAVQCDGCDGWQHRKCQTGITAQEYRLMVRGELDRSWYCGSCAEPSPDEGTGALEPTLFLPVEEMDALDPTPGKRTETTPVEGTATSESADRSIGIQDRGINVPLLIEDALLEDPPLENAEYVVTFTEVEGGTKRGSRILVSSDGFTYTLKTVTPKYVYWICSVRTKTMRCCARVKQYGDHYLRGLRKHIHEHDPGANKSVLIRRMVKEAAKTREPRAAIAPTKDVMKQVVIPGGICTDNLVHEVNITRQKLRPRAPNSGGTGCPVVHFRL